MDALTDYPYLWDRDAVFYRKIHYYRLIKGVKNCTAVTNACGKFAFLIIQPPEEDSLSPILSSVLFSPCQQSKLEKIKEQNYDLIAKVGWYIIKVRTCLS